jgi:hypothetical protein
MIHQNLKFTQQELPATAPDAPSACVIDFFETRDRLSAECVGASKELAIEQEIRKAAARRERSVGRADLLEESLYWLISTAVIAYLVLGILGL